MDDIEIGDFVVAYHPNAWHTAKDKGCLNKWELSNQGKIMGQVIGTYGPWDILPESKFHWDIVPDCWILSKYHPMNKDYENGYVGSFQMEPKNSNNLFLIVKDIERTRDWKLSLITNDFSTYTNSFDEKEYAIEKSILIDSINRNKVYTTKDTRAEQYYIPV